MRVNGSEILSMYHFVFSIIGDAELFDVKRRERDFRFRQMISELDVLFNLHNVNRNDHRSFPFELSTLQDLFIIPFLLPHLLMLPINRLRPDLTLRFNWSLCLVQWQPVDFLLRQIFL